MNRIMNRITDSKGRRHRVCNGAKADSKKAGGKNGDKPREASLAGLAKTSL